MERLQNQETLGFALSMTANLTKLPLTLIIMKTKHAQISHTSESLLGKQSQTITVKDLALNLLKCKAVKGK